MQSLEEAREYLALAVLHDTGETETRCGRTWEEVTWEEVAEMKARIATHPSVADSWELLAVLILGGNTQEEERAVRSRLTARAKSLRSDLRMIEEVLSK